MCPPMDAVRHDTPAELTAESDAFEHRDYSRTLAEYLTAPDAPSTVALFGPWGVGKSTILTDLGGRLSTKYPFVLFDAWRYEGEGLRRHFLRDVARQLKDQGCLQKRYNPRE